uniref:Uncharacterized protein n=1 Tax=Sphaerodactylus townsendi TaxID=933632 RepID=A0ACB8F090_9SAUR
MAGLKGNQTISSGWPEPRNPAMEPSVRGSRHPYGLDLPSSRCRRRLLPKEVQTLPASEGLGLRKAPAVPQQKSKKQSKEVASQPWRRSPALPPTVSSLGSGPKYCGEVKWADLIANCPEKPCTPAPSKPTGPGTEKKMTKSDKRPRLTKTAMAAEETPSSDKESFPDNLSKESSRSSIARKR